MGARQSVPDAMEFVSTMLHAEIPTRADVVYAPDAEARAPPTFSLLPHARALGSMLAGADGGSGVVDAVRFAEAVVSGTEAEDDSEDDEEDEHARHLACLAERGDALAQVSLGAMCYDARDLATAAAWYRKAAEQGDARAQVWVGNAHYDGEGVAKDLATAAEWYQRAAGQSDTGFAVAVAQFWLGRMYHHGEGVALDLATAAGWYLKAAALGEVRAQYQLGCMYYHGDGVAKDLAMSAEWYRKAAEHGGAQVWVGHTYRNCCEGTEPSGTEPSGSEPSGSEPSGSEPSGSEPSGGWVSTIRAVAGSLDVRTARLYPPTLDNVRRTVASGRAVVVGFSDDDESDTYPAVLVGYGPATCMQLVAFRRSGYTVEHVGASALPLMFSFRVVSPP
jgi:TPR repeat protein